ncbi:MAG: GTP pyrophosphokinase [Nanoarchaeota archaeon]|nr:GTP pyrophosphokinase [Nanoarchaeota archaeon]
MKEILKKAEQIAREAHKGQKRRDGKDYITHPEAVAKLVYGEELKIVAWLHDVIEDTNTTPEDLQKAGIPHHLIHSVQCLSRKKDENYCDFIIRCSKDKIASLVKIADLKHNISDLQEGSMKDKYRLALHILKEKWK